MIDNVEMQRIVRDDYYANEMNNLEEMGKFLEKFNLPRLSQEKKNRNFEQTNHIFIGENLNFFSGENLNFY